MAALRAGDEVDAVFACTRKDRLTGRSGSAYLALELRDRTGTIPARVFRDPDFASGRFDRGDLVRVQGRVDRFRDELQLELQQIERADDAGLDPAAFLPIAYRDLEELDGFLEHLAREVHDADLRRLLGAFMDDADFREAFRRAPCTRGGHHAYLGGLIEHTVAVATLVQETCVLHPRLDSDLLMTAALLHDVGKTREFTFGAEIALSDEGALLGHVALGQQLVVGARRAAGRLPARAAAGAGALHPGPPRARRPAGAALRLARGAGAGATQRAGRPGQGRAGARAAMRARRARADDFERVTELLEILGRAEVTPDTADECRRVFEAQVAGQESAPLVVEDEAGTVIACCSLHFRPRLNRPVPDAWIPDLVVRPRRPSPGCRPGAARGGRAAGP